MVTSEAASERVRPRGTAEYHEYERSTEERGVLRGARRLGLPPFGITVVGLAMAFAGGMTKDLLVSRVPLALQSPLEIGLGVGSESA